MPGETKIDERFTFLFEGEEEEQRARTNDFVHGLERLFIAAQEEFAEAVLLNYDEQEKYAARDKLRKLTEAMKSLRRDQRLKELAAKERKREAEENLRRLIEALS